MKIGVTTYIWTMEFTGAHVDLLPRIKAAGFDGVELHYAHAYTMSSFLSRTNDRADGYGGSRDGRVRLPLEVIDAVRRRVGKDWCVGVRYLGDEVVEDAVRDRLVEVALVAERPDVELQALQLDAALVRHVADADDAEVGEARLGTHRGELGAVDRDLEFALGPRVRECLDRNSRHLIESKVIWAD